MALGGGVRVLTARRRQGRLALDSEGITRERCRPLSGAFTFLIINAWTQKCCVIADQQREISVHFLRKSSVMILICGPPAPPPYFSSLLDSTGPAESLRRSMAMKLLIAFEVSFITEGGLFTFYSAPSFTNALAAGEIESINLTSEKWNTSPRVSRPGTRRWGVWACLESRCQTAALRDVVEWLGQFTHFSHAALTGVWSPRAGSELIWSCLCWFVNGETFRSNSLWKLFLRELDQNASPSLRQDTPLSFHPAASHSGQFEVLPEKWCIRPVHLHHC